MNEERGKWLNAVQFFMCIGWFIYIGHTNNTVAAVIASALFIVWYMGVLLRELIDEVKKLK